MFRQKKGSSQTTSSKGSKGTKRSRKNRQKQAKNEDSQQVSEANQNGTQALPVADELMAQGDMQGQNGLPPMDETEMILLNLHSSLIDFYTKHKPENVDEDVLTILMQFFIDAGGVALNKKLMDKYGEDLNTFKKEEPEQEPPLPPIDLEYNSKTMQRMKRQSLEKTYNIELPPPPMFETNVNVRNSVDSAPSVSSIDKKRKKKKVIDDPELNQFKAGKDRERAELEKHIDAELFGDMNNEDKEDPSLRLDLLDKPDDKELAPRDLIEAFYSKHDESKLDKDTGIEKFVMWVDQNGIDALSKKLEGKYKEGLFEQTKLARRRRNLEDRLTAFYLQHDRPKLDTRWTIMKILSWTMTHGVVALNKKFVTRYGFPVIDVNKTTPVDDDLDI